MQMLVLGGPGRGRCPPLYAESAVQAVIRLSRHAAILYPRGRYRVRRRLPGRAIRTVVSPARSGRLSLSLSRPDNTEPVGGSRQAGDGDYDSNCDGGNGSRQERPLSRTRARAQG